MLLLLHLVYLRRSNQVELSRILWSGTKLKMPSLGYGEVKVLAML